MEAIQWYDEEVGMSESEPLRCVAASWAPMAAAVISGAIMAHLERESYILEPCRCIGGREW